MIYVLLFWEFFKIGLLAIGGGMVTIPFLFDLSEKFNWFTPEELTDMIAVSQSTPGPVGVNMATYAGFMTSGILGGFIATLGLVLPSLIICVWVAKFLRKWGENKTVTEVMDVIRPAVVVLILEAGYELFKISVKDYMEMIFLICFVLMVYFWKKSPIFYILGAAILGVIFKL